MTIDEVVILAGGKGSRMLSKTPKVLQEIKGCKLLHLVYNKVVSVKKITLVISEILEKNFLKDLLPKDSKFDYIVQKKQNGTGHAVLLSLPKLNKERKIVAIVYGDTPFFDFHLLEKSATEIKNKNAEIIFVGFHCNKENDYGKLVLGEKINNNITSISDILEKEKDGTLCNSGLIITTTDLLHSLVPKIKANKDSGEYYLTDLARIADKENRVVGCIFGSEENSIGINSPEDLILAEELINKEIIRKNISFGMRAEDYRSLCLSYEFKVGEGSYLESHIFAGKNVKIGKNCFIGSFVRLENCTIGDNVRIESNVDINSAEIEDGVVVRSFSVIRDCYIKKECEIGPFARIYAKSCVGEKSKVGNFVEIKNSTLGKKVKTKHLTYLGDSAIKNDVNIGAGCVVCNYDGFNKNKTVIESDSFIGSGTLMIAPINIGSKCIIGAGAVLNEDIEEGALVIPDRGKNIINNGAQKYRNKKVSIKNNS